MWLTVGGLGAALIAQHDARIALGWERAIPWLVVVLHLAMGAAWALVLRRDEWVRVRTAPAMIVGCLWIWGATEETTAVEPGTGAVGHDVVVITLDTFRADHVREDWTPNLWALGEEGSRFTQAVTTAPLTAPAHASMWSGLEVQEHGLLANGRRIEAESVVTRAHERGYRTGAFLSAHVLDTATGLDAGWDHYDDRWGWRQRGAWWPGFELLDIKAGSRTRSGDETVERARTWLAESEDPALVWVHLYDAHGPYVVPSEFRPAPEALERARGADQADLRRRDGQAMGLVDLLHAARPAQQTLQYRAGVRYVDHLVGELLDGLDPDTRVLVVGDHGESLDEHDYFFNHGALLYEPSIAVPFLVRAPGFEGVRDELVSVTAVHDLVEAMTGGPAVDLEALGTHEVLAYTTGQQARREALANDAPESRRAAAVRVDGAKLVVHGDASPAWYDLRIDPDELTPLPVPESMSRWLDRLDAAIAVEPPALSDEDRGRLEALGYVE
ncbi:MAG: sulfatase [Proteobacteria bacterium]|nr:sulfatase [Pseudomonadota bacterium]MCP4919968.1 sulfatase [Pseudomonadota bacterium]